MKWPTKIAIILSVVFVALLIWAAGPPPGTFLVPSFFTTNAAKIYGTGGIGSSSNPTTGIYTIDGSSLSNSIAGALSNKVDELGGVATNLSTYGITNYTTNFASMVATNPMFSFYRPGDSGATIIRPNADMGMEILESANGNSVFDISSGQLSLGSTFVSPIIRGTGHSGLTDFLPLLDGDQTVVVLLNGTGALTNDGNGVMNWFNGYITAASLDGYGFIFGATNIGSTIGRGSNFVLIVESNLTMFATNYPADGGTNVVKVNTAQPITTTAQPTFAGLTDTGNLAVQGTTTNTGAINSAGVETNWNDVYMRALVTAGINANGFNFGHDTALAQTNADGGARWASFAPNFARRRCGFFINNFSGSVSIFGENSTTTGTVSYETPQTNSWWTVVYTTAASPNADAGWNHNTTASWFPGGDICYDWVGRISAVGTNQIRVWMGLTDTTLANMNGTDSPTTRNVAMVRYSQSASDANWQFVTCNASACTVTPSNTAVSTNRTSFRMVEDIVNGRWVLYINGVSAATNSANLPVASMGSNFSIRSLNGTAYAIRHSSGFVSVGGGKGNPAGDFP